ncbi:MAG TPA: hypothetical protein VKV19_08560 [Ktedonobacteraceae bacterium]|nr:hypothetical protein [Ktedonobacteraceae bacterium]
MPKNHPCAKYQKAAVEDRFSVGRSPCDQPAGTMSCPPHPPASPAYCTIRVGRVFPDHREKSR